MNNCSFSSLGECHQGCSAKTANLRSIKVKEDEETIEILHLRTKVDKRRIKTICSYHEGKLLTKFSVSKKKCCDPIQIHPDKARTKSLKTLSLYQYKQLFKPPETVVPGEKFCTECFIRLKQKVETSEEEESDSNSTNDEPVSETFEEQPESSFTSPEKDTTLIEVNSVLASLDETPVKFHQLPSHSKRSTGKRKLVLASGSLKKKLELTYDVSLTSSDSEETSSKDLHLIQKMMGDLKMKYQQSKSHQERIQILTISPFSIQRTMEEFGATNYMVKKSRQVKKDKGVLGLCDQNKGKPLADDIKRDVTEFYENDDYSRIMPGKKDFVSVKTKDGDREKHQKRLILSNLRELHNAWKETYPDKKIGFSTFASLRPKWCVLAGASGTHSVCVCKYHQNPKLMAAVCLKSSLSELMAKTVCSTEVGRCMMGQCKDCPGKSGLLNYLNECDDLKEVDEIKYLQWISTDRTSLVTITEPKEDFIENFSTQILKLTRHSFTAKSQSAYMNELKSTMKPLEDIILQGDFAENFSYVVQDEIQSFHWENKQATMHPFVAYRRREDGTLEHKNICVVSDCREHSAISVHAFLQSVIPYLKTVFPEMKKIHYFTDGCAGQYKNKYNFLNLCFHLEDFGIDAEWNFFATSHGKSACDGLGGTVKRLLTKASLQRPYADAILTSDAIMKFCTENIPGIHFINVQPGIVEDYELKLKERLENAKTIVGTLKFHRFVPLSKSSIKAFKLSKQEEEPKTVCVAIRVDGETDEVDDESGLEFEISKQNYVCAIYDENPWIGLVEDISDEYGDYYINFMHPHGPIKYLNWPLDVDRCWIENSDILCVTNPPLVVGSGIRIRYKMSDQDSAKITSLCRKWQTR